MKKNVNGIWLIKLIDVTVNIRIMRGNLDWLIQPHTHIPKVLKLSNSINKRTFQNVRLRHWSEKEVKFMSPKNENS